MKIRNKSNTTKNKQASSKKPVLIISIIVCLIIIFIISGLGPEETTTNNTVTVREVSVLEVNPHHYPAIINVFGEVVPEWQSEIKSQVNGLITYVSPKFRVGRIVNKGDTLIAIEDSQYVSLVAEAKTRFATAKINLLSVEKEAEDALENWKRSGIQGDPMSELVLMKPQLEAARNEYDAAKAALRSAELELSYTRLTAPFNGIIADRYINLGEAIGAGMPVLTLFSTDKALITTYVSNRQFNLLSTNVKKIEAKLTENESGKSWKAKVVREGNRIDHTNRLRALILEVNNPLQQQPPLLAGQFLSVALKGEELKNIAKAPESVLTDGGFVWYINTRNQLYSFKVVPLFYLDKEIYFSLPDTIETPLKIAINPNSSFMNGITAKPVIVKGE